ncbi:hypothetical protein NW768_011135 [Fusarium equiseti]|uniref:Uncharacterized protein n=1 Tax=Fusarium equiseti TaxID=61235 RepID=A0ABQ8QZ12_FUSEQ|nr:hypothetical protein NW768_011135 [Fusarium equiseti]
MDQFSHAPKALETIVRWSRNLEKLSIIPRDFYNPYHAHRPFKEWDFATVQPILETQMANLRELSILPLFHGCDQLVRDIDNLNLTGFTKLEVLTLSSFQTGYDTRHIPRILAPNLRILNWLVPVYNSAEQWAIPEEWVMPEDGVSPEEWAIPQDWVSPEEKIEDFDQKKEDWVRAMVDFAAKEQQRLREIYIGFKSQEQGRGDDELCVVHPARLEKLARDSEKLGIKIRYDGTSIEKVSVLP